MENTLQTLERLDISLQSSKNVRDSFLILSKKFSDIFDGQDLSDIWDFLKDKESPLSLIDSFHLSKILEKHIFKIPSNKISKTWVESHKDILKSNQFLIDAIVIIKPIVKKVLLSKKEAADSAVVLDSDVKLDTLKTELDARGELEEYYNISKNKLLVARDVINKQKIGPFNVPIVWATPFWKEYFWDNKIKPYKNKEEALNYINVHLSYFSQSLLQLQEHLAENMYYNSIDLFIKFKSYKVLNDLKKNNSTLKKSDLDKLVSDAYHSIVENKDWKYVVTFNENTEVFSRKSHALNYIQQLESLLQDDLDNISWGETGVDMIQDTVLHLFNELGMAVDIVQDGWHLIVSAWVAGNIMVFDLIDFDDWEKTEYFIQTLIIIAEAAVIFYIGGGAYSKISDFYERAKDWIDPKVYSENLNKEIERLQDYNNRNNLPKNKWLESLSRQINWALPDTAEGHTDKNKYQARAYSSIQKFLKSGLPFSAEVWERIKINSLNNKNTKGFKNFIIDTFNKKVGDRYIPSIITQPDVLKNFLDSFKDFNYKLEQMDLFIDSYSLSEEEKKKIKKKIWRIYNRRDWHVKWWGIFVEANDKKVASILLKMLEKGDSGDINENITLDEIRKLQSKKESRVEWEKDKIKKVRKVAIFFSEYLPEVLEWEDNDLNKAIKRLSIIHSWDSIQFRKKIVELFKNNGFDYSYEFMKDYKTEIELEKVDFQELATSWKRDVIIAKVTEILQDKVDNGDVTVEQMNARITKITNLFSQKYTFWSRKLSLILLKLIEWGNFDATRESFHYADCRKESPHTVFLDKYKREWILKKKLYRRALLQWRSDGVSEAKLNELLSKREENTNNLSLNELETELKNILGIGNIWDIDALENELREDDIRGHIADIKYHLKIKLSFSVDDINTIFSEHYQGDNLDKLISSNKSLHIISGEIEDSFANKIENGSLVKDYGLSVDQARGIFENIRKNGFSFVK